MNRTSHTTRFFLLLGLLLLVASTAGAIWALHPPGQGPTDKPKGSAGIPAEKTLTAYGFVDVENGVTPLYPVQPGRVTKVLVTENQKITDREKEPLLELDDTLAKQRLEEARADWEAAKDQLEQANDLPRQQELKIEQQQEAIKAAQEDLVAARKGIDRLKELVKINQKPTAELEMAQAQVRKLEAAERAEQKKMLELKLNKPQLQINRAKQDLAAKKARLDQAELGVKECKLLAPGPGVVLQVNVSPGTVLTTQPIQPAIVFCADKPYIVRVEVEQEFANRVAIGQGVIVQEENSTRQTWRGKLTRIADWYTQRRSSQPEALRISTDIHTLECIVVIERNEPRLRIGQRVRVEIGKE
jgi:multidrug resistance efflux pump